MTKELHFIIAKTWDMEGAEKDIITVEKAMEILKKGGLEVTRDEAKKILDFLIKLADITLAQSMVKRQ